MSAVAVQFEVTGLFGEFDHQLLFPENDEFAIIHGPNGVGKTRFLELIAALSSLDVSKLESIPFINASLRYNDGAELRAVREDLESRFGLTIMLKRSDEYRTWIPTPTEFMDDSFTPGPEWNYEGMGIWLDQNDGERVSDEELRRRYGVPPAEEVPSEFTNFTRSHPVHLITTHRLSSSSNIRRRRTGFMAQGTRPSPYRNASTVSRYAFDITEQLKRALTENSRETARLDRTFPQRLLKYKDQDNLTEAQIRERYSTQNQQRERLARFSLIASEPDLDLPVQKLEPWHLTVLSLYLDDTKQKLDTFEDVMTRAELFEEIVNRRFLRKTISVDAEEGLRIETTSHGNRIRPEDLSSGEQHELIMFYDMLFRVPPGALVLVDEPEISLHVGWQRQFLDDMERVSNITKTRFVVATHSPQIIGNWWSRTTVLGGVEPERDLS